MSFLNTTIKMEIDISKINYRKVIELEDWLRTNKIPFETQEEQKK